jgi:hypothetical protein
VSFISLSKRFKQKSNLLRLNLFISTQSEFHFHGIKISRLLKIPKVFCTYVLSFSRNFWDGLSVKGTSFLRSVIGAINNIKHSLFVFPSNTYSYELENSMNESGTDHIHFPIYNSSKKYIHT